MGRGKVNYSYHTIPYCIWEVWQRGCENTAEGASVSVWAVGIREGFIKREAWTTSWREEGFGSIGIAEACESMLKSLLSYTMLPREWSGMTLGRQVTRRAETLHFVMQFNTILHRRSSWLELYFWKLLSWQPRESFIYYITVSTKRG